MSRPENATDFHLQERSPARGRLRESIGRLLTQLKRRIRRYVLLEGLSLLVVLVGALFWVSLLINWAYFRLTALELPIWFREAMVIVSAGLLGAGFVVWIVLRYSIRLRSRSLALVLERRFPQLGSRLITAVELAETRPARETELTAAMIERTIDEAAQHSQNLPLESVFDLKPLRRAIIAAVCLVAAAAALIIVNPAAASIWKKAYLTQDPVYWPRQTQLTVRAVMQPGDRLREFRDGKLKHPRGVDLVLQVDSSENGKTPAVVELNYVLDGGRGAGRIEMVKIRDGQFRHTLSGLIESVSLWISGGDYVTRVPLRVEVVEPPRLDQVGLDCEYPAYTGIDRDPQGKAMHHIVEVQGSQVALPMETSFAMQASANKPLAALRLEIESRRISLTPKGGTVAFRMRSGDWGPERPLPTSSSLFLKGQTARIPFLVTAKAEAAAHPSAPKNVIARSDQVISPADTALPIEIPGDSRLRIELEDTDDITSIEPIRIVINGTIDQPPTTQSELRGIGPSITRKAVIPVAGTVTDDYGIATVRFEFRVDNDKDWRVYPFRKPPARLPKEFVLRREENDNTERFEVLPLDLKIGQKLVLCVCAEDGDNLNGPHLTRGEQYTFQIVSDEELLSLLYVKEVNLRERFEKIISELERVQKDLVETRGNVTALAGRRTASDEESPRKELAGKPGTDAESGARDPSSSGNLNDLETAAAVCAQRSLHQVRTKSVETASVEDSFRGLLEELVNNGVHTQAMVERIGERIVQPLHQANEKDFSAADQAIGLFKLAIDGHQDAVANLDRSTVAVSALLVRLKSALHEMQDLVKFHEAISRLQAMIKEQQQIIDATRQEQKRKRLKELKGLQ